MKIALISTMDYVGGASRAAYRLHNQLRASGHGSQMFVYLKFTHDSDVRNYKPAENLVSRVRRTARRSSLSREKEKYASSTPFERTFFTDDRTQFGFDLIEQMPDSDVIHLHWTGDFLDYPTFFRWLSKSKPLVWTLHDMANLTGGCCYDLGCGKFTQRCGACPQLGSQDESDLSRQIWLRKRDEFATLDASRVHIVTPSVWLANEVKKSPLMSRFACSVIPYGLDLGVFQPRSRQTARDLFGVPQDAKVILFLADGVGEYRKGFHILAQALTALDSRERPFLLSLGKDPPPGLGDFSRAHFSDITNDRILSFAYSAADLFVAPSLADNLPNTILESMACGTPVVAFDVGGVPDMVRPGVTGLLVPPGDANGLKHAVLSLLVDPAKRAEMSANCRRIALAEYNLLLQAQRYSEIYEALMKV